MSEQKKLKRTKQCAKCPWRVETNPHEIPNEYSVEAHKKLSSTISDGGFNIGCTISKMSCHEHHTSEHVMCVGWLMNQLGAGNNIALRLQAMQEKWNIDDVKLLGEQHERFEDTLPKNQN